MKDETNVASAAGIAGRVRALRRAAGMTQVELADGRFTKQYVSQIERGEVVPSDELLAWLAERLGVEPMLIATGLSSADLERVERDLAAGQALLDEHRYLDAIEIFRPLRQSLSPEAPRWAYRGAMRGETWALIRLGSVTDAAELMGEARMRAEGGPDTADERAEIAYLTAVCCYTLSTMAAAHVEFARALSLLDEAEEPNDRLRSDVHQWRSRCYRRQRDWEAAREDIDRALELVEALDDTRRSAEVNLQASLVAERQGRWVLARRYAEKSRDLLRGRRRHRHQGTRAQQPRRPQPPARGRRHGDRATAGGVRDLRRRPARRGGRLCPELPRRDPPRARRARRGRGRRAACARLLEGRRDHVQEIGTAQLVLARAHLDQGDLEQAEGLLAEVDESYALTESISHQARSWMVRGELELLRENESEAARLYREAATALQPTDI